VLEIFGTEIARAESETDMEQGAMGGWAGGRNRRSSMILAKNAQILGNFSDETASTTRGDDFSLDNQQRVVNTIGTTRTD
jgi:hypothetical protein